MKTILDLFGHFSKNETRLRALDMYVKIITDILLKENSLKEDLAKNIRNTALALDQQGEEELAVELRKFLTPSQ